MTTGPMGYDISGEGNELVQEDFKYFASHLVGLALLSQPLKDGQQHGPATCFFRSGFVMQFGTRWYWATAGHVLEGIYDDIRKGKAQATGFRFADHYGAGAMNRDPVPFDFDGAWKYYVHDSSAGLDFAVVEMGKLDRKLLEANGIVPVRTSDWKNRQDPEVEAYFILGLTDDAIHRGRKLDPEGYVVTGRASPSIVGVEQVTSPPQELLATTHPRFVGKISPQWPAGSIEGMSGGPVIALLKGYTGHRIVAIQSGWLPLRRIAYACPLRSAGPMIERELRKR